MANPNSRVINWHKLTIERDSIYLLADLAEENEPDEYFIQFQDNFYSLEPSDSGEEVAFEGELKKRCIDKAFRTALVNQDFLFKGKFGKTAYFSKKSFNDGNYDDIFAAYTAFEYRIWQNFDGVENQDYLVLDPRVAFIMKASVHNMVVEGLYNRKIEASLLNNYAVKISKEAVHEIDEHLWGIDGVLVDSERKSENNLECHIRDSRTNELHKIDSQSIFLEPRPEIIRDVILSNLGISYDVVKLQQDHSFLTSKTAAQERLNKTLDIVNNYLSSRAKIFPLEIGQNKVEVDSKLTVIRTTGYPKHGSFKEPKILFDNSDSSATHLQPYQGLKNYGPFTKDKPEIKLGLLGDKFGVNKLNQLIKNLNKGTKLMPDGMSRFFNTRLNIVDSEIIDTESLDNYVEGANALSSRCNNNGGMEISLVSLPESTSEFNYDTPYYNTKPIFLGNGITSQYISKRTLGNLEWSYGNIASAIFAKSGAYPWVLAEDIKEFDIIIGIGLSQAVSTNNRAGSNPKFIGFANVFDKQGRWMFFETTSELYNEDNPVDQIKDLVKNSVLQYNREQGSFPKSIAVHYYQRFSEDKINAVNSELSNIIGDFRIAYITLDKSHPMRLYDISIDDRSYPRGHYALLSENMLLLSTTGYTDLAKRRLGTPQILNVTSRQYPERFISIEDIAQNILALTKLNYKTLTPTVGEPVTLLFSNLVAKFMAAFSETQFW